ncbi:class I SAM-dependent methyltransferase [Candidatus Babeliales bacterium]|nr:class I SAM-dependent methyltransferase [Candidatus Babeliales bacterium]
MVQKIISSLTVMFLLSVSCIRLNSDDTRSYVPDDLPAPYNQLKELLPFNGHHFYMNALWMELVFAIHQPKVVVEVGSWLGGSTRHMASLMDLKGKLYAVDTFEGSEELLTDERFSWMIPTLYEQFLSNVIHAGLTDRIIPVKMRSTDAAEFLKNSIGYADLVYIDAAHDTDSVYQDITAYFSLVAESTGIMCGDDWMHPPVQVAVMKFAYEQQLTVYVQENFWLYAKEEGFSLKEFLSPPVAVWQFS